VGLDCAAAPVANARGMPMTRAMPARARRAADVDTIRGPPVGRMLRGRRYFSGGARFPCPTSR
jgi:hypothetical protein